MSNKYQQQTTVNEISKEARKEANAYLINEEIRYKEVMLIGPDGDNLGIMSSKNAYFKAKDANLDLVCIQPKATIPVCKLLNYGKFRYEQQKKAKAAKKNQHNTEIHEVQLKYAIAEHDLGIKADTVKRLIDRGDDVRIVLRLRGREETFKDLAKLKVERLMELCKEFTEVKKELYCEGRDIIVILKKKKV